MQYLLTSLSSIKTEMQKQGKLSNQILKSFNHLSSSLEDCWTRLHSATKIIDYFLNDILDYTTLKKNPETFIKNMEPFDLSMALDEILKVLEH